MVMEESQEGTAAYRAKSHDNIAACETGRLSCGSTWRLLDNPNGLGFCELLSPLESANQKSLQNFVGIFRMPDIFVCCGRICSSGITKDIRSTRMITDVICNIVD